MDQLFSVAGRTAFITGASSGIGLHAAQLLSKAGAGVALAARRVEQTERAAEAIRSGGGRAVAIELDVTQTQSIPRAWDLAAQALGAVPDILINNAGVILAERFVDQKEGEVKRLFETNLEGAFFVAQEAARRMSAGASIVNIASTSGLRAGGYMASYAASKAGLIHASRVMALELAGKGIRVNALCPGNIETDMQSALSRFEETMRKRTPLRRFGKLEDLDGALLLLASDAGRYITGATLAVDGGQTLSWM